MEFTIIDAIKDDPNKIFSLYYEVAKSVGGLAREEDEISSDYINNNLIKSLKCGKCLVVPDTQQ